MSGDLEAAVKMLAADNARMCDILIAADDLAHEIGRMFGDGAYSMTKIKKTLEAFKVARQGH